MWLGILFLRSYFILNQKVRWILQIHRQYTICISQSMRIKNWNEKEKLAHELKLVESFHVFCVNSFDRYTICVHTIESKSICFCSFFPLLEALGMTISGIGEKNYKLKLVPLFFKASFSIQMNDAAKWKIKPKPIGKPASRHFAMWNSWWIIKPEHIRVLSFLRKKLCFFLFALGVPCTFYIYTMYYFSKMFSRSSDFVFCELWNQIFVNVIKSFSICVTVPPRDVSIQRSTNAGNRITRLFLDRWLQMVNKYLLAINCGTWKKKLALKVLIFAPTADIKCQFFRS